MNILDPLEFYTLWFYVHLELFEKKCSANPNTLWPIDYLSSNHADIILFLESMGLMLGPRLYIRKIILDEVPEGVKMPKEIQQLLDKEITLENFYDFDCWWYKHVTAQSPKEKQTLLVSNKSLPQGFSKVIKREEVVSPSRLKKYYLEYIQHVIELGFEVGGKQAALKDMMTGEYVQEWYEESATFFYNQIAPLMVQIGKGANASKMKQVVQDDQDELIREHLGKKTKQVRALKNIPDDLFLPAMCWLHEEGEVDVVDIVQDDEYHDIFDVCFKYPSKRLSQDDEQDLKSTDSEVIRRSYVRKELRTFTDPKIEDTQYTVGSLKSWSDGRITYKDKVLDLEPRYMDLCRLFMKNHGALVTYDDIKDNIIVSKKRASNDEKTINKYVADLHKILKTAYETDEKVFKNKSKQGYIFNSPEKIH